MHAFPLLSCTKSGRRSASGSSTGIDRHIHIRIYIHNHIPRPPPVPPAVLPVVLRIVEGGGERGQGFALVFCEITTEVDHGEKLPCHAATKDTNGM